MQQTLKPNRIVLWLGDDLKDTDIPLTLRKQEKRGLEIRYCKDILSYKKLIPSLKAFPSSAIITIDDDLFYFFDLIENLVNAYKKNNKIIHCTRMHRMKLISVNKLAKYSNWSSDYEYFDISPLNFPTGGAGAIYPPNCFNDEIFNDTVFMEICKYADDVWFKAMSLLNNVSSQKVYTHRKSGNDYYTNENTQDSTLSKINLDKSMNDVQLKAVFDKYNLYEKLVCLNKK